RERGVRRPGRGRPPLFLRKTLMREREADVIGHAPGYDDVLLRVLTRRLRKEAQPAQQAAFEQEGDPEHRADAEGAEGAAALPPLAGVRLGPGVADQRVVQPLLTGAALLDRHGR